MYHFMHLSWNPVNGYILFMRFNDSQNLSNKVEKCDRVIGGDISCYIGAFWEERHKNTALRKAIQYLTSLLMYDS